ncbi:hypothetical protein O6H91_03G024400 [Diphasiastrum complanatum]|uniref:Uncharacterized protein n=1 Tax=Diphasiastrum complanatum TaxID=34168 RepID=A0ACC2E4M6_DIPCM|nr:hypothetical protein O6H91_03G024400 [Diphasiastrum complanatum]
MDVRLLRRLSLLLRLPTSPVPACMLRRSSSLLPDFCPGRSAIEMRYLSTDISSFHSHEAEASTGAHQDFSLWPGLYRSPVTAALWSIRSKIPDKVAENGCAETKLLTRTPDESRTSVLYAFSIDPILRELYRSPWNHCRIGKLLEDLDALAGTIAMKHCAGNDGTTRPLILVTASVDKISLKKPIRLDTDLKLAGAVAWTGRSSMQIRMQVIQPATDDQSEDSASLIANFTFVARDAKTRRAAPVNPLVPQSDEEKELFLKGQEEDSRRKQEKMQNEALHSKEVQQKDERLRNLLAEGRILIDMPALANRYSVLMQDTKLENALICQPQQRNLHGRIFGGFLMRRAFELAFSTCYVFGGQRPIFLEVDHVDFHRPVDVGNLLRFKSCVLYTETENIQKPLMHVEVAAFVTQPESRFSEVRLNF